MENLTQQMKQRTPKRKPIMDEITSIWISRETHARLKVHSDLIGGKLWRVADRAVNQGLDALEKQEVKS